MTCLRLLNLIENCFFVLQQSKAVLSKPQALAALETVFSTRRCFALVKVSGREGFTPTL